MVDLTKILNAVVAGSTAQGGGLGGMMGQLANAQQQGGLGNILGQLAGGAQQQQMGRAGGGGLADMLGGLLGGAQQMPQQQPQAGGLGGLLGGLLGGQQQPQMQQPQMQQAGMGGLGDLIGKLAGQAGQQGQGGALGGLLAQLTQGGQSVQGGLGGMLAQAAEALRNGQVPGGAAGGLAAGGLAAVLLGTETGRAVTGSVAKLGAMAAMGGLAYLALKNYQAGNDVVQGTMNDVSSFINGAMPQKQVAQAVAAVQHDDGSAAVLMLKSMVAAAAADGVLDAGERHAIVGQMEALGLTKEEQAYLNEMLANPASIDELANEANSDELRAQAYIAANLAIEVDTAAESSYIQALADGFGFDPTLKAHLDHASAAAKAPQSA